MKSNRTLRDISIQFPCLYIHDPVPVRKCYFPLKGFRNLTSLELYAIYKDYDRQVKDMASVLCESPFLKKFSLGFASEVNGDDEAILFGGPGREADFFKRLCEFYGSKCKKPPLALETLRLGWGIFLDKPSEATGGHYLTKLLTIKSLKVLHLYNGFVESELEENDLFCPRIDWTPFTSEDCRSLRQLSVTRLEEDVVDWLKSDGCCVQELIVTDHYSIDDEGLDEFINLPSRLSMLWTREKHPSVRMYISNHTDSDWSDTDSSVSDTEGSESLDLLESTDSQWPAVDSSLFSRSNAIACKLDKTVMTVLDRLPDGGSHLTRLCTALDFETQWVRINTLTKPNDPSLPSDHRCTSPLTYLT